jgi:hypothetical protein
MLDIVFHGPRLILAEFVVGVFLPLALGLLSLLRGRAAWQSILGVYLILVAINYVPLLVYALIIVFKGDAHADVSSVCGPRQFVGRSTELNISQLSQQYRQRVHCQVAGVS